MTAEEQAAALGWALNRKRENGALSSVSGITASDLAFFAANLLGGKKAEQKVTAEDLFSDLFNGL